MSNVTIVTTNCHRNGVGGDPFYVITFQHDDSVNPLTAIVPTAVEEKPDNGWAHTYVIDPTDPTRKWRGDAIYHDLVNAGLWNRIQADNDARWETTLAEFRQANSLLNR